uniref:Uncharacterized protein n=1 Tax=Minutocellus polymorphus TaxID=265543 RepID=A0A7S0FTT6_9STRA|mmetsp:Transcript_9247/g.15355  ORF Transcript_9247/g.15355 Transcript_9247/m.15355 type:complete len:208 (+) Transcript_9247:67-690(+)
MIRWSVLAIMAITAVGPRSCQSQDMDLIICPDGQKPIPDTFCGRGPNRVDCSDDEFCFIHPTDRFAVCCPNENNDQSSKETCCDPRAGPGGCPDANGSFEGCWDEGGYCCTDGRWHVDYGDGSNNCNDNSLEDAKPCECNDFACCVYIGGELKGTVQCYDALSGKTFSQGGEDEEEEEEEEAVTSSAVIVKGCTVFIMLWPLLCCHY